MDLLGRDTVHNQVWKAAKHVTASSEHVGGIKLGTGANAYDAKVQFPQERIGR
jgi:hypothetical protein